MCGLRLSEHRRRVQRVAPRPREELGGAQKHSGTLLPRPARPVLPRLGGRVDRLLHVVGRPLVHVGEDVILVVRHHGGLQVAGRDVLTVDHERDLDPLVSHLLEAPLEPLALGRPGRVAADRLVHRHGWAEDRVRGHGRTLRPWTCARGLVGARRTR